MNKIKLKTEEELAIMLEGGKKLAEVKRRLALLVKTDVSALEIEEAACKIIEELGAVPSFKKVPNYKWATCINVNDGVVHGIPRKDVIFKDGDVISVDVGVFYKDYHTDSAFSVNLGGTETAFLEAGRKCLNKAIESVKLGRTIYDISSTIEKTLKEANLNPIKALTGHGVGKDLHEAPAIPCYVDGDDLKHIKIVEGMALAVEIMYTKGSADLQMDNDGWTIRTEDGKIAALFEDTVAVTKNGTFILTR